VYNSIYNDPKNKNLRKKLRQDQTEAERKVWNIIRGKKFGYKFFRQYSVGPYILDFFCPVKRLALEIDGCQHNEVRNKIYDSKRTHFLKSKNITVFRFYNNEVLRNIEGVYDKIASGLNPS